MNSFDNFHNLTHLIEAANAVTPCPDLIDAVTDNLAKQRSLHVEAINLYTELIIAYNNYDFRQVHVLIDTMQGVNAQLHEQQ